MSGVYDWSPHSRGGPAASAHRCRHGSGSTEQRGGGTTSRCEGPVHAEGGGTRGRDSVRGRGSVASEWATRSAAEGEERSDECGRLCRPTWADAKRGPSSSIAYALSLSLLSPHRSTSEASAEDWIICGNAVYSSARYSLLFSAQRGTETGVCAGHITSCRYFIRRRRDTSVPAASFAPVRHERGGYRGRSPRSHRGADTPLEGPVIPLLPQALHPRHHFPAGALQPCCGTGATLGRAAPTSRPRGLLCPLLGVRCDLVARTAPSPSTPPEPLPAPAPPRPHGTPAPAAAPHLENRAV